MDDISRQLEKMTPLQRAVFALKETQARLKALEQKRSEPIAIVGMACRFPGGAIDPASYWQLLCDGVDAIDEIPPDRWDVDAFYDPDPATPGKMNTRWGGFLPHIDHFDNHFFGISDREAERIDPQHRLVLELAWEALEDAGFPPSRLRGSRTGVFLGLSHSEYGIMLSSDQNQTDAFVGTGTANCIAANRVSFAFDFSGPSLTLDSACASSLVALHVGCQSIRSGESELALVGGVSAILSPLATINLTKAGLSAADGRVRAFDAAASGYVRGEGAGLLVLQPLSAAVRDKNHIYAVVRGSAVNQNGCSNGLTAPSRQAQEKALREAYAHAQLSPGQVQYVEAQGTGTPLGDAIEALALGHVLAQDRPAGTLCRIGSVKTNIGHLEAASGTASLIKVALAMQHRRLPPTLHFKQPNPDIPFAQLPLKVQQRLEPWPDSPGPRVAGVSGFGFGGSNAHVVLQQAPDAEQIGDDPSAAGAGTCLLSLSARTEDALRDLARRYQQFLRVDEHPFSDVCASAATGRDHHDCRLAILAASHAEAADLLDAYLRQESRPGLLEGRKPYGRALKVAFLYDGQVQIGNTPGSVPNAANVVDRSAIKTQNPEGKTPAAVGSRSEPRLLRQSLVRAVAEFAPHFSESIQQVDAALQHVAGQTLTAALGDDSVWNDPVRAVPAATALQLGLAAWWRDAGLAPDVVFGRGAGELAAACTAGMLSTDDALQAAAACGRGAAAEAFQRLSLQSASLPFVSALDGKSHTGADLHPTAWQRCLDRDDGLESGINDLLERRVDVCVHIGGNPLGPALAERAAEQNHSLVAVPSMGEQGQPRDALLQALATLYCLGVDLIWDRIVPTGGRPVKLPTYPWQRQRRWVDCKDWLVRSTTETTQPVAPQTDDATVPLDVPLGDPLAVGPADAMPLQTRPDMNTPYVAPRTKLEKDLARSWSEVLRIDRVGIHDNFFELGGDSLQATILLNLLQQQLSEDVPAHVLFQIQTIDDLAAYLRRDFANAMERLYPEQQIAGSRRETATAAASPIPRVQRDQQAEQLLARLDELTEDEVESLLQQTSADNEVLE